MKRRIQPLQHRARLLCEYTNNADPMRTSKEDLNEELFQARFNRLIKARPGEGRQYEESLPMYTATNPRPKLLCRTKVQFLEEFGFAYNKLACVILQIPGVSAAGPAGTSSSSKATKRPISFSSAPAESRERKSQPTTVGTKSSEDDDALAGLNIPSKR